MECCGFLGPQEFAYSTLPIDDSCYEPHSADGTDDSPNPYARSDWEETTFSTPRLRLKQVIRLIDSLINEDVSKISTESVAGVVRQFPTNTARAIPFE